MSSPDSLNYSDSRRDGFGTLPCLRRSRRNSRLPYLNAAEKDKLGGVEYRAICLLSIIVPVYFVLWQFLGAIAVGASIALNHASLTERNGIDPWLVFLTSVASEGKRAFASIKQIS